MTPFNSPISILWYSLSVISSKAVTVESDELNTIID